MRFGVIFCGYNCADTYNTSLSAWRHMKNSSLVYSIVSSPFESFPVFPGENEETIKLIEQDEIFDFVHIGLEPIGEAQARGVCLNYLKEKVDYVILVDLDEIYKPEEIARIIQFLSNEPLVCWFRLCLKNYVFDTQTYLSEPFCPPRIFKVRYGKWTVRSFSDDNDICYCSGENLIHQREMPSMVIPKSIVWVKHLSWLSNERSKRKVEYQRKRWGKCSFAWNYQEEKLEFDLEYYYLSGLPKTGKDYT